MVDFMYKYLIDMNITPVPPQHLFYTTCDKLNVGSQALQKNLELPPPDTQPIT